MGILDLYGTSHFFNNRYWHFMCSTFFTFTIVDVIGAIINCLTLLLAYRIYKSFDVKKTHVNKQLETVLSLVEEINKTIIAVRFNTKIPPHVLERMPRIDNENPENVTWVGWHYSLLIIGRLNNDRDNYGNVFISEDIKSLFPYLSYINDPLLPKSIANKLNAFYSPFTNYTHFDKISDSFVTIGRPYYKSYQYPDFAEAFKNWDEFIRCAKELQLEIENWLKKHGAEDINFNYTLQYPT